MATTKPKKWIAKATKNKGALHRHLGITVGQRIPVATLRTASRRGGLIGREAHLALTLRGLNRKK